VKNGSEIEIMRCPLRDFRVSMREWGEFNKHQSGSASQNEMARTKYINTPKTYGYTLLKLSIQCICYFYVNIWKITYNSCFR
jgi:hypothetical protein